VVAETSVAPIAAESCAVAVLAAGEPVPGTGKTGSVVGDAMAGADGFTLSGSGAEAAGRLTARLSAAINAGGMPIGGCSGDASSAALRGGGEESEPPGEAPVFLGSVFTGCPAVTPETRSAGGGTREALTVEVPCACRRTELADCAAFLAAAVTSGDESGSPGGGWSIAQPGGCKLELPSDDCGSDED